MSPARPWQLPSLHVKQLRPILLIIRKASVLISDGLRPSSTNIPPQNPRGAHPDQKKHPKREATPGRQKPQGQRESLHCPTCITRYFLPCPLCNVMAEQTWSRRVAHSTSHAHPGSFRLAILQICRHGVFCSVLRGGGTPISMVHRARFQPSLS